MNRQVMRVLISLTVLLLFLSACVDAQNKLADKKVFIIYLSRTSNIKAIAQIIQKNVGGDLVAVEQEKPYPTDYKATVYQVVHENETGYLQIT